MAASPSVTDSRKRSRTSHLFLAETLCLEFDAGACPSCNKRIGANIIERKVSPFLPSAFSVQPGCVSSSSSAFPVSEEDVGSSSPRSRESLAPVSSRASAITDAADSTAGSTLLSSLPHECFEEEQQLCFCVSSAEAEEAESCCGENTTTTDVDITSFLLHEVWEDTGALTFNPETIFLGISTDFSDDDALADCSAENGNWFLNDLGSQGHGFLNEVLDQEWMAEAVANLDRINDSLDTDLCVLHLLESDHADGGFV